ncbi:pre-mRNA splicing factor prp46 [Gonapodya prolifera JEL478]|uniref:Pre-mRNA splicing factor prp46 n=1 Tax=Gonapodya prolifera (strain JEL478) TaxID=1344416 RepID=A0A139AAM5_GONPJ|nr:pre-mRNA splicing factor prp46 [Gonapodya prolifera JEL478]|eukprot:KXS13787.1 pre-mRNA splicing factor prp46 [Gonapodya prolifera JEL478]
MVDVLIRANLKRSRLMFEDAVEALDDPSSQRMKLVSKIQDEYANVQTLPDIVARQTPKNPPSQPPPAAFSDANGTTPKLLASLTQKSSSRTSDALVLRSQPSTSGSSLVPFAAGSSGSANALIQIRTPPSQLRPKWHPPWRLMRVISGHLGWVRAVAVDPGNEWFVTGGGDRLIKIWDLASGTLKLSLTGHISTVRGVVVSDRHPYLFSCGEDKQVKCWDLEQNKVVRHYHGHLSGVYSMALHPTLDVLVTGGRDSVARVWDIRTKNQIFALAGHSATVSDVKTQEADPQVITASMDSTVRLWDLAAGKAMATLTHHKKSVRALAVHPNEFSFASASPDNIKQWRCPRGDFIQNFEGHNSIINTLAINSDNVMFSGGDNGSMHFWDWKSGHCFQTAEALVQPGSLESEAGVFCSTFDRTGTRLITGEADKTIKIWKEDERATEETHPLDWKPKLTSARR